MLSDYQGRLFSEILKDSKVDLPSNYLSIVRFWFTRNKTILFKTSLLVLQGRIIHESEWEIRDDAVKPFDHARGAPWLVFTFDINKDDPSFVDYDQSLEVPLECLRHSKEDESPTTADFAPFTLAPPSPPDFTGDYRDSMFRKLERGVLHIALLDFKIVEMSSSLFLQSCSTSQEENNTPFDLVWDAPSPRFTFRETEVILSQDLKVAFFQYQKS
ncbi:hypothetical protein OCU04_011131 [Sclerotinia nivalis]|uniref:Uncharacterized protein n=1 Tax=Sclerotinia nivalis TaxID=352851 RepID=A0A9X0AB66_9HELO|nr:hypothetical protein OCU04_011131 [Sclerotinia nivalis]